MKRQTASKLLALVNNQAAYVALQEYLEEKIEGLRNDFMHCENMGQVEGVKRAINELKVIQHLRDAVNHELQRSESGKN